MHVTPSLRQLLGVVVLTAAVVVAIFS